MTALVGYNEKMTHARPHTHTRHETPNMPGTGLQPGEKGIQNGCDKTTVGRLRTSHKRGEPVAITRQMFVVGEVSYRHYTTDSRRRLLWPLKHFAPNSEIPPSEHTYTYIQPVL